MFDRPEEETHKVFDLSNGNQIHFRQVAPYSLWQVKYDRGQAPKEFRGLYTSFSRLFNQVKGYLESKDIKIINPDKYAKSSEETMQALRDENWLVTPSNV